ncbi:hypothetical protein, partial [Microbacterium gubbeenense]|uniref:hypothetical protein n=1 Tax=Microbacterium gubbeenense TaxID=159896 RepID=UPI003F983ED8
MGTFVDLGHGRGWLADDAAASLARIDAALGHAMQVTEAGRSQEKADENYAAYLAYLNGSGPWAPIALPGNQSVHCLGRAIDTDEGQEHITLLAEHGWRRTVYRAGRLVEPWHFEYFADEDQHINEQEDDDMFTDQDREMLKAVREQLGGANSRKTSAREDIDKVLRYLS